MLNQLTSKIRTIKTRARFAPIAVVAVVGVMATPCGGQGQAEQSLSSEAPSATATERAEVEHNEWVHEGSTTSIVSAVVFEDEFFDAPGVTVVMFSSDQTCADPDSYLAVDRVEVFYPADGDSFGEPISVWYKMANAHSLQENRPRGFDGNLQVTKDGQSVSGWVNADRIGPDSDAEIRASFEAELCGSAGTLQ